MKEATGEANLTVVAILLIAVVVSIATPLVMSLMKRQIWRACCTDAGGVVKGQTCEIDDVTFEKDDIIKDNKCQNMDDKLQENKDKK